MLDTLIAIARWFFTKKQVQDLKGKRFPFPPSSSDESWLVLERSNTISACPVFAKVQTGALRCCRIFCSEPLRRKHQHREKIPDIKNDFFFLKNGRMDVTKITLEVRLRKTMMNKLSKMALWVFPLLFLAGCGDDKINQLKSENDSLSIEIEDVTQELRETQKKLRDAQDEIDQLKRR
jgi:outer membrane murein-binding lipoprotein Lpp